MYLIVGVYRWAHPSRSMMYHTIDPGTVILNLVLEWKKDEPSG